MFISGLFHTWEEDGGHGNCEIVKLALSLPNTGANFFVISAPLYLIISTNHQLVSSTQMGPFPGHTNEC